MVLGCYFLPPLPPDLAENMVLDLSMPSNQSMALSADVIKGWLCILVKLSVNLFNTSATAIVALDSPLLWLTSGLKLCLLVGYLLSFWLYLACPHQGLPGMCEKWGVPHASHLPHGVWWCWLLLFHWLAISSNWCISSLTSLSCVLDLSKKLITGVGAGIENKDLGLQYDSTDVLLVSNCFIQEFSASQSTLPLHHTKYHNIKV